MIDFFIGFSAGILICVYIIMFALVKPDHSLDFDDCVDDYDCDSYSE